MFQLTALYRQPADNAAFDKHYREVHAVLASKLPGLRQFRMNWTKPGPDGAAPAYYFIATLFWDSEEEFAAAAAGEEMAAALADLPNFAQAGVDITTGPAESVV